MKKRGFTLVETILVVAIIALLATLVSPVLKKAKSRAESVGCGANLTRLGVAVHAAANDNDNIFPAIEPLEEFGPAEYPEGTKVLTIHEALEPYGITEKDLQCPSDKTPIKNGNHRLSYGWNARVSEENTNNVEIIRRRNTVTAKMSKLTLFMDIYPNHHGRQNRVYADGHVRTN